MECDRVRDELALVAMGEARSLPLPIVDHVTSCAACRSAYRDFLATADQLASAVPIVKPPTELKESVLRSIAAVEATKEAISGSKPAEVPHKRSPKLPARTLAVLAGRGRLWGAAAALLAVINGGLIWSNVTLNRELNRVVYDSALVRSELVETWRAFSGAPAQSVGELVFSGNEDVEDRERLASVTAEGYLYQRPNGWSVLIQVRGIDRPAEGKYHVWLRSERGWEQVGPLMFDGDGVGTFIYYAREPEVALESLRVVTSGVLPGTPEWRQASLVVGQAVFDSVQKPEPVPFTDEAW